MKELFSSLVSGAGSMILSTAECISLHMETSGRDGDTYPSSKPGMITTEQLRGTNGIGTCVAERRPIEIIGAEHYLTVGHRWSCSAAPIFDSKNQLIAVLNVSQLREKYHSHTLGMVRAAAYAISEQLRLRALLQQQQAIIELLDEGVIVVSRSGEVKLMNSKAASMLGLPPRSRAKTSTSSCGLRRCSTTSSRAIPISWIRKRSSPWNPVRCPVSFRPCP